MRTIIAGSRAIHNYDLLKGYVAKAKVDVSVIISGGATGVDNLAIRYAKEHNIPCEIYIPNWQTYGRGAGFIRNQKMANKAEALIAIWDGMSRGTSHMINIARGMNLMVVVFEVTNEKGDQPM